MAEFFMKHKIVPDVLQVAPMQLLKVSFARFSLVD